MRPKISAGWTDFAPLGYMAKVGALTGVTFGVTLACLKGLLTLCEKLCKTNPGHFRSLDFKSLIGDSVLFAMVVCSLADTFFVMTSTDSSFNYKPYSTADEFELVPTLTQMGFSALSTMLGGLAAYVVRGGLRSLVSVTDKDVWGALQEYRRQLSLNSHCVIL